MNHRLIIFIYAFYLIQVNCYMFLINSNYIHMYIFFDQKIFMYGMKGYVIDIGHLFSMIGGRVSILFPCTNIDQTSFVFSYKLELVPKTIDVLVCEKLSNYPTRFLSSLSDKKSTLVHEHGQNQARHTKSNFILHRVDIQPQIDYQYQLTNLN